MSSILRSSKFVRYFANLARNIVISNRQEVDGTKVLHRSQHLSSALTSNFSSSHSSLQAGSTLERTVRQLDDDARRIGRISMKEVEEALNEIRLKKKATSSQSLMVIRCCGNLVPEEAPEQRTQLVEEIWNTLQKLGVSLDISHYNALLKVYLENEHKFSPTEFLARLEKQGVEPNRVTYQRLIAGYCQMGDIAGATRILEFMKEKQLPVSEGVFNALILGHSRADDMESAEGMLGVMKQANLEPSNETYTTLLCGYAQRGDKAAVERLITDCKVKDVLLSDRDVLDIAYAAGLGGHDELLDEVLKNIRNMAGYNQDATNTLLRLLTKGKDHAAYKVFQTMHSSPMKEETIPNMSGHVLIKQLVKTNRPVGQILEMCETLAKDGHTKFGLWLAIESSFHQNNIDLTLSLLKALKEKKEPVRNHYFWPSLITAGKSGNNDGLFNILWKMVNEFEISPNPETLKEYYLPYTDSVAPEKNLKALVEAGVGRRPAAFAIISHLVSQNKLKKAVDLALQNPGLNIKTIFLNRLLMEALQETGDVKNIVSLVHIMTSDRAIEMEKADEDEENGAVEDIPGRFLISVVSSSQTRNKTAEVVKEMLHCGLGISGSCAEIVESRLQGNELTTEISDLLAKLSAGQISPTALKRPPSTGYTIARNPVALEQVKEKMIANNEPKEKVISIVRTIFQAYCFQGDLENALRLKQEWIEDLKQEMTPGFLASLLELYCSKGDLEGAKQCMDDLKKLTDVFELDPEKIMKAAKLYIQNNQLNEAIDLIKTVKPREERGFQSRAASYQALLVSAETTKDPDQVKKLFQTMLEMKYIEVSNVNLGPIIKAYLLKEDVEGALKEFERCVKMYRATPWKNEIASRLIEKEDAVNLQTLVDLSTQVHGEINSLYDLVLSFVECGRIRQARKILETPGLRARNTRIQSACERYKNEGMAAPLEGLVEATKDLPHIDRSEIYFNLLETYRKADNVEKAYSLWTQMQDEDVHVSDEFMIKLGNFLKSKNLDVPFEIPKQVGEERTRKPKESIVVADKTNLDSNISKLLLAIREQNVEEALKIKENLNQNGTKLNRRMNTSLLELLISKDKLRESTSLLLSLEEEQFPFLRAVSFLVNKLSQAGDMDSFKHLNEHLSDEMKKMTSFTNRYLACAVAAGKAKEELDLMEKKIENATTAEEIDELALSFPRGGIFAVLESSPSYHEQVTRIVEKYYSKGVTIPANCMCMFYMGSGETEKAKELFQRYNLSNSSRIMFQNVLTKARKTSDGKLIEDLISLLKDAPSITPEIKGLLYSNLINIYVSSGNDEAGLAKLEEALKSTTLENIYIKTLFKLKEQLEAKNIPFKFIIPPKTAVESSSSSSSSDIEPKKTVAAKH